MKNLELSSIDRNFCAGGSAGDRFSYHDVLHAPFELEGFAWRHVNREPYYRLPESFTKKDINPGALQLAHHTAGACVRFRSNSTEIAIRAKLDWAMEMKFRTDRRGFDCYVRNAAGEMVFHRPVQPSPQDMDVDISCGFNPSGEMREWLINLPLYGGVSKMEIGVVPGAELLAPPAHKVKCPILFYGSSITQGGCASRPGNGYASMLCRKLDAEQINLGFSGCALGEIALAEAIGELELSALVIDYDHNAPTEEHLAATHEPFFQAIRRKQADLPIIIMSRCDFYASEESILKRREIIRATYENACRKGDAKVWFIDGETLFGTDMRDACRVDCNHPNDLGFYRMYEHVLPVLQEALS